MDGIANSIQIQSEQNNNQKEQMLRRGTERRAVSGNNSISNNSSRGKKTWTDQEDETLRQLVSVHGTGNWTLIAQSLPERSGKQCRERFHNHLDQGIKKGDWTEEEDRIIIVLQKAIGNQWAKITKLLPGRTDNAVKNRFHATERAKSRGKLDESFLNDPNFTEFIIKEAMRVNGELQDSSTTTKSIDSSSSTEFSPFDTTMRWEDSPAMAISQDSKLPVAAATFSPNKMNQNSNRIIQAVTVVFDPNSAQYNADLNGDDDDDDEMDEDDDNDEEENSVDDLMELDIISFDEDDMDFLESEDESGPVNGTTPGKFEIDPCCFNFDWNGNNSNNNQGNKPATTYNLCGLEAWGMSSNQHNHNKSVPNAIIQTGRGELQQKQNALYFQSHQQQQHHHAGGLNHMNVTNFFSSR